MISRGADADATVYMAWRFHIFTFEWQDALKSMNERE
jgi:hypothetical protein